MAARKPTQARSKPGPKPSAKQAKRTKTEPAKKSAKKAVAKKPAGKKTVAEKPAAKKAVAKKPAAKKPAAKEAVAKKPAAKKAVAKPAAKKAVAKKTGANKTVAKPPVAKKALAEKPVVKLPAAKKAVAKPPVEKPVVAKRAVARATPARDAVATLAQKKAINATLSPVDDEAVVEAYMRDVDHPFKAEMQAVRAIILGTSSKISERIKWNAPSFFYKQDLGAFHPPSTEFAHLILLFPGGDGIDEADETELLEGNHKDRREAKFRSLDEVAAKKPALERLVQRWVALRDAEP